MSAEASGETTKIKGKIRSKSKDRTLPEEFSTVTCGDSVEQKEDQNEKFQLNLNEKDDDVKEGQMDESWTTYSDTAGKLDEETEHDNDEEKQQAIWDRFEPSEANLNKLDGWGAKMNLSSTKVENESSEIDSLTSPAFEHWVQENLPDDYIDNTDKNDGGKKPRVRWADIESRLQSQSPDPNKVHMIPRCHVESTF